ncbi:MAG: efflux RND transporter permease subunit [Burkholderiaceae bacterium]
MTPLVSDAPARDGLLGVCVRRPVGICLLALGLALFGWAAFLMLPVAPLPQVEYPTIQVRAQLPGADPATVADSLTSPLEKRLGLIAGLKQMSSSSRLSSSSIVLQFELDRDINGAARDVQAALDAARGDLPPDLPRYPTYSLSNPSDAPLMLLALTSRTSTRTQIYQVASDLLQQRLMQVDGVGDVTIGGGALPAVRVELQPGRLTQYHVALEDIRAWLRGTNVHQPLGVVGDGVRQYSLSGPAALEVAGQFRPLEFTTADGSVVHLSDFGRIEDSVEDVHNFGLSNDEPAILMVVHKQPGANVIEASERVKQLLPALTSSIPRDIHVEVIGDRTKSIDAALDDVELTLLASIGLVVAITFFSFRDWRAALVPAAVVPLSLLGTFVAMAALGFSLNLLSLMALAISTGFVVDDAIVVTENIIRHLERGASPFEAAVEGVREIVFTVVSISLSLIAVFLPLLLMSGLVGRLFREFAVSMAIAVMLSMALSLTLTPTLSRLVLARPRAGHEELRASAWMRAYERSLRWTFRHRRLTLAVAALAVACNAWLLDAIPKGFFPQEDIDKLAGMLVVQQDTAFPELQRRLQATVAALRADPDVEAVVGFVGAGQLSHVGTLYVYLRKRAERSANADEIIERLVRQANTEPGTRLYLQASQNLVIGGRRSAAQYQLLVNAPSTALLATWEPKVLQALHGVSSITQVNTTRASHGGQRFVQVDRDAARRLGVDMATLDQTLYDAFGQRRVSTLYMPANEYRVVIEVAPEAIDSPGLLGDIRVPATGSSGERTMVPLSAFASLSTRSSMQLVTHAQGFPSETLSFNLAPGRSLSEATQAIATAIARLGPADGVTTQFVGSAQAFQDSLRSMPLLVALAIVVVYLVLGMLYESLLHPLTILSTLPSAGVGAMAALMMFHSELSVIAVIGIILLIGIVKKNAIMLVDFALVLERQAGRAPEEAMFEACLVRLRPILMTTAAALFGAVPLVIGSGYGSEFRRPLGISIIGGLVVSQILTIYTTPAVYVTLTRWREALRRRVA